MSRYVSPALLLPVALAGCGVPALVCRAPDVAVRTAEGDPYALCDLTFSACADEDYLTVSCTNDTFEGDYACGWMWLRDGRARAGEFRSDDFCQLDADAMIDELNAESGLSVTVE